jgi:FkbM family methyltransferase
MRQAIADALRKTWGLLPRSRTLFKLCRMYANFYAGENNSNLRTNGELRAMRRLLPRCAVAFDVGANVGEWVTLALDINPALSVHCFEPASTTFATLAALDLPADRVVRNQLALGDQPARATLHLHAAVPHVNTLHPGPSAAIAPETGVETVTIDTLDHYCRERGVPEIDYLKIDVEGHELAVLRGATEMIARRAVRYIHLEYGAAYVAAGARLADVFDVLAPAGYAAHKIHPGHLEPVSRYEPGLENYHLSNWIFARPGAGA